LYEPQVKGIAFRSLLSAVPRVCGPTVIEQTLPLLPDLVSRAIRHHGFLTGGWYPLAHYRALHGAIGRVDGRGYELARVLGRDATLDDFRGVYRVLTFVLSPEFLMRRAPGLFNRYYDTGSLSVPIARRGYAEANFHGCTGFDRTLWEVVIGGAIAGLEACGARDVQVEIRAGGGDGEDFLRGTCTWR
jgi:hypothetical protein